MSNKEINIEEYVDQFYILEKSDLNSDILIQMLYSAILNRFKITFQEEEYNIFREYQERIFNLIENLRELDVSVIASVLIYLDKKNHCLPDIIIMMWSMPRIDSFLSKKIYNNHYKDNIAKYNSKIIELIEIDVVKNFCIESLTKTNYVPIHCIDFLWYYMNGVSYDFVFYNLESAAYIGITVADDMTELGLNMEYLLEMGLGKVVYKNDPKGSFRNFLKSFFTDVELIKKIIKSTTGHNFYKQLVNINKNIKNLLGEDIEPISDSTIKELKNLN